MKFASAVRWLMAGVLVTLFAAPPARAGDPVPSLHPLHEGREAVALAEFEGRWVCSDSTSILLAIEKTEEGYELRLKSDDETKSLWFDVHLVRLGSTVFADIRQRSGDDLFLLSPHVFARIRVNEDELRFEFLEDNYVRKALEDGRTDLAHEWMGSTLVLTAPTDELQDFVESCAFDDEAFDEYVNFTRMKEQPDDANS